MENLNIKKIAQDPNFNRPLSELNKDYSKQGQLILITKIKIYDRNI
jgi:hypothetical protein